MNREARHPLRTLVAADVYAAMVRIHSFIWLLPGGAFLASCAGGGGAVDTGPSFPTVTMKAGAGAKWAAFQDGNGIWKRVSVPADGVLKGTVTDPTGKYGWAVVDSGLSTQVYLGTLAETPTIEIVPYNPGDIGQLDLTLKHFAADEKVMIVSDRSWGTYDYSDTTAGTLSMKVGTRVPNPLVSAFSMSAADGSVRRMAYMRDIPATTTAVELDMTGADSFVPDRITMPAGVQTGVALEGAGWIHKLGLPMSGAETCVPPAGKLLARDVFVSTVGNVLIRTTQYGLAPLPTANFDLMVDYFPTQTGGTGTTPVTIGLPDTGNSMYMFSDLTLFRLSMSQGWHGAGTVSYTFPDFKAMSGWSPTYSLPRLDTTQLDTVKYNVPLGDMWARTLDTVYAYGQRQLSIKRSGRQFYAGARPIKTDGTSNLDD